MVPSIPGSLSKADEAIVRKLFKALRATRYEDPVDQDAFLVESANTVVSTVLIACLFAFYPFTAPVSSSSRLLRACP